MRNTHKEVQVHDPVEYQTIKQEQPVNNHSIESYFTICHSASFSSQVSITMMKNKLFKLENNQSTKQVSITMKKNKLFKRNNNQSTKQVSITIQDSRVVACNLSKNKVTLRNLPRPQNTNYRTLFFPPFFNKILKLHLYKPNSFIVTNCYDLLKNIRTVKIKI